MKMRQRSRAAAFSCTAGFIILNSSPLQAGIGSVPSAYVSPATQIILVQDQSVSALEAEIAALQAENRTLGQALAQATEELVKLRETAPATHEDNDLLEDLKLQNKSLRATIKAQSEVMTSTDGAAKMIERLKRENAQIQGLKETIKQLQAQNDHLSSAGSLGGTAADQIMAAHQIKVELEAALKKEKENAAVYRQKIKDYEVQILALEEEGASEAAAKEECTENAVASSNAESSDVDELTALRLENQDLKARLELAIQKAAKP